MQNFLFKNRISNKSQQFALQSPVRSNGLTQVSVQIKLWLIFCICESCYFLTTRSSNTITHLKKWCVWAQLTGSIPSLAGDVPVMPWSSAPHLCLKQGFFSGFLALFVSICIQISLSEFNIQIAENYYVCIQFYEQTHLREWMVKKVCHILRPKLLLKNISYYIDQPFL